jgi:GntR family transcriptional regulator, galactonate operon transcriptional repressor
MTAERPRGLHGQVVHMLGTRILSGEFPPGAILDLPALEGEFGISHTVLRESLKVLTAKGLVGARQKRGTFVTEPAAWNMLDDDVLRWRAAGQDAAELFQQLGEVRLIIEPAAAALAAQRAEPEDIAALNAILETMRAAAEDPDNTSAADADVAFHATLLRATHNELLAGLRAVIEHGLRQRDLIVHAHAGAADPIPAHRAVLDQIERRDSEGAAEAMLGLLNQAASDFDALPRPRSNRARSGPRRSA